MFLGDGVKLLQLCEYLALVVVDSSSLVNLLDFFRGWCIDEPYSLENIIEGHMMSLAGDQPIGQHEGQKCIQYVKITRH